MGCTSPSCRCRGISSPWARVASRYATAIDAPSWLCNKQRANSRIDVDDGLMTAADGAADADVPSMCMRMKMSMRVHAVQGSLACCAFFGEYLAGDVEATSYQSYDTAPADDLALIIGAGMGGSVGGCLLLVLLLVLILQCIRRRQASGLIYDKDKAAGKSTPHVQVPPLDVSRPADLQLDMNAPPKDKAAPPPLARRARPARARRSR